MTKNQIEMLKSAIDTHISMLYRDAETYRRNENKEAQMDCLSEVKKYRELKLNLSELSV